MLQLHGAHAAEGMPPATVVTIGMFDGVHCGHQALIQRAVTLGAEKGLPAVALTFDKHADEILRPEKARPYLTTLQEKITIIRSLGVSLVVVARVTPAFLAVPPRDFISRTLHKQLHARAVVVGPDFHFGIARQGDTTLLAALQKEYGYTLEVMEPFYANTEQLSSTMIRRVLSSGEVARARVLMGRPYRLSGAVAHGEAIGRTLGFPTANLTYPPRKILPALGVYLCRAVTASGDAHPAVVNIGRRPTFDGTRITVEAFLLDFSGNLYDQELTLDFLDRLRPEQKFADAEALKVQLAADVEQARQLYPQVVTAAQECGARRI